MILQLPALVLLLSKLLLLLAASFSTIANNVLANVLSKSLCSFFVYQGPTHGYPFGGHLSDNVNLGTPTHRCVSLAMHRDSCSCACERLMCRNGIGKNLLSVRGGFVWERREVSIHGFPGIQGLSVNWIFPFRIKLVCGVWRSFLGVMSVVGGGGCS